MKLLRIALRIAIASRKVIKTRKYSSTPMNIIVFILADTIVSSVL